MAICVDTGIRTLTICLEDRDAVPLNITSTWGMASGASGKWPSGPTSVRTELENRTLLRLLIREASTTSGLDRYVVGRPHYRMSRLSAPQCSLRGSNPRWTGLKPAASTIGLREHVLLQS